MKRELLGKLVGECCAIIETGDQRLMAGDGPCGNQPPDISLAEWRKLYRNLERVRVALAAPTEPSESPEPTAMVERVARWLNKYKGPVLYPWSGWAENFRNDARRLLTDCGILPRMEPKP